VSPRVLRHKPMSTATRSSYHAVMLATLFRPRFAVLAVLVVVTCVAAAWPSSRCERRRLSLQQSVLLADGYYRTGHFTAAERTLRDAAAHEPDPKAEELHVVASFYGQLRHSLVLSTREPSMATLHHLDQAIQFDGMLGGAYTEQLERRRHRVISAIGPE
jgi:hypothetical protein